MKILYVTTIGRTMSFFTDFIRVLLQDGHQVDIATNENNGDSSVPDEICKLGCSVYHISCTRSPLSKGNLKCIKEIRKIVQANHYDIVHCHTPIASACTRLACRKIRKSGTKVIYTAHGFHFYTGAPIINWILYYSIEKICAKWTDVLITINTEDFSRAKRKFKATGKIVFVPGVGIDTDKFSNVIINRDEKRVSLGLPKDAFILLSVGELNENKNHQIVIRALAELKDPNMHYVIAGKGNQKVLLEKLANDLGVGKQVHLLGHRNDIPELDKMADVYLLPSYREGLNVSVMEAMSSGLPCIVSDIRGNRDMVEEGKGGYLINPRDFKTIVFAINRVKSSIKEFGSYNARQTEKYSKQSISILMKNIYKESLS